MASQLPVTSSGPDDVSDASSAAARANVAELAAASVGEPTAGSGTERNAAAGAVEFGVLRKVPMTVQVEVGRTVMTLGEILDELEVGTSIRLDRHAGDPVEVYVNGTLFARAEVVVAQDQIGAKIIELVDPARALRPSGLR